MALNVFALTLLGLLTILAVEATAITHSDLGWASWNLSQIAIGVVFGLIWLAFYAVILRSTRPTGAELAKHHVVAAGSKYIATVGVYAAFCEETWRAFCVRSLAELGAPHAIVVTSLAASLAHYPPLGRSFSSFLFSIAAAVVFLETGTVWSAMIGHALVNIFVGPLLLASWRRD
jgi:hypothetical protein